MFFVEAGDTSVHILRISRYTRQSSTLITDWLFCYIFGAGRSQIFYGLINLLLASVP